jgi:hypothetical protein
MGEADAEREATAGVVLSSGIAEDALTARDFLGIVLLGVTEELAVENQGAEPFAVGA